MAAVRDWSDGRYSKAGCNLKFLLDWAWARVVHIKDTIDTQTVPLFDHSLAEIDEGGRGVLVSLAGQLAQLVTVISSLSSQGGVITELGADTLDTKLNVTGLVLLYTQVSRIFWSPPQLDNLAPVSRPSPGLSMLDCCPSSPRVRATLSPSLGWCGSTGTRGGSWRSAVVPTAAPPSWWTFSARISARISSRGRWQLSHRHLNCLLVQLPEVWRHRLLPSALASLPDNNIPGRGPRLRQAEAGAVFLPGPGAPSAPGSVPRPRGLADQVPLGLLAAALRDQADPGLLAAGPRGLGGQVSPGRSSVC